MTHIKKYLVWYILGLIILILIAYQLKWFGNTKTLFKGGGSVPSGGAGAGGGFHPSFSSTRAVILPTNTINNPQVDPTKKLLNDHPNTARISCSVSSSGGYKVVCCTGYDLLGLVTGNVCGTV